LDLSEISTLIVFGIVSTTYAHGKDRAQKARGPEEYVAEVGVVMLHRLNKDHLQNPFERHRKGAEPGDPTHLRVLGKGSVVDHVHVT